jgi:hypothetical protein
MTGIQFITDAKGRKTAAVIDLKKHSALWEDIEDALVSRSRRHEKRIPLEKVKADLIALPRISHRQHPQPQHAGGLWPATQFRRG